MKPLILVFPGQASQYVGMGKNLYESFTSARAVMREASSIQGLENLQQVAFEGPEELLTRTDNVQPAITAVSLMALAALKETAAAKGMPLDVRASAGHSLGEYSAHAAAGNLGIRQTLVLTKWRGEWMNQAAQPPHPKGAMLAVMGLPAEKLEGICAEIGSDKIGIANINSPGQIILSGEADAVVRAGELCSAAGAKRTIPLNVSGAWHSPLMRQAQEKMARLLSEELAIEGLKINASIPVVANASSDVVGSIGQMRDTLSLQITSPVNWIACVRRLIIAAGYPSLPSECSDEVFEAYSPWPTFVEVGPGKVLRGLLRNIDKRLATAGVEDATTLEEFTASLTD